MKYTPEKKGYDYYSPGSHYLGNTQISYKIKSCTGIVYAQQSTVPNCGLDPTIQKYTSSPSTVPSLAVTYLE